MTNALARIAATASIVALFSAGAVFAQPTMSPQGGGGNSEMDHSRMGGQGQVQTPGRPAPTLSPQGGGGNSEMDHSRMGGGSMGGPSGGRITGNSGSGGGPDVQHGTVPAPAQPMQPTQRR